MLIKLIWFAVTDLNLTENGAVFPAVHSVQENVESRAEPVL